MEIGSMGSMADLMGVQGMGGSPPPKPDAEEMSSKFVDALDSDGDGGLSEAEFAASDGVGETESSEVFDALDTNEDGIVSQEEIQADMEARMGPMPSGGSSSAFSGISQDGNNQAFQALMDMVGGSSGTDQAQGAQRYGSMQDPMFGEQGLSAGLNLRA